MALILRRVLLFLMRFMNFIIRLLPKAPSMRRNGMNCLKSILRSLRTRPKNLLVFMRRNSLKDGKNACPSTLRMLFLQLTHLRDSKDAAVASRKLSEIALTKLVDTIPELVGGSADLTGSNLTRWKGAVDFQPVPPKTFCFY